MGSINLSEGRTVYKSGISSHGDVERVGEGCIVVEILRSGGLSVGVLVIVAK